MKWLKLKCGLLVILILLIISPKGLCSINETLYLSPLQSSPIYTLQASKGDTINWRFETYDDPFTVTALCTGVATFSSNGKTSDTGSTKALVAGGIIIFFQNIGSNSGYIDIRVGIRRDTIDGYQPLIFVVVLISLIGIISITKIKKKH